MSLEGKRGLWVVQEQDSFCTFCPVIEAEGSDPQEVFGRSGDIVGREGMKHSASEMRPRGTSSSWYTAKS